MEPPVSKPGAGEGIGNGKSGRGHGRRKRKKEKETEDLERLLSSLRIRDGRPAGRPYKSGWLGDAHSRSPRPCHRRLENLRAIFAGRMPAHPGSH